jgi:hypothetical protein
MIMMRVYFYGVVLKEGRFLIPFRGFFLLKRYLFGYLSFLNSIKNYGIERKFKTVRFP